MRMRFTEIDWSSLDSVQGGDDEYGGGGGSEYTDYGGGGGSEYTPTDSGGGGGGSEYAPTDYGNSGGGGGGSEYTPTDYGNSGGGGGGGSEYTPTDYGNSGGGGGGGSEYTPTDYGNSGGGGGGGSEYSDYGNNVTGGGNEYNDAGAVNGGNELGYGNETAGAGDPGGVPTAGANNEWNLGSTPEYPTEAPQIDTTGVTPQYSDDQLAQNRADTFGQYQDTASPGAGNPQPGFEHVATPEYPTQAPHIDTAGVTPQYTDEQLAQNRADTFGHYQDTASPGAGNPQPGFEHVATPEYPTQAPHIDTAGVTPQYTDAQLAQNRADTFAHHQDLASPPPMASNEQVQAQLPTPEYPTAAPHIDTTGVTPQYTDAQLAQNRADTFANQQDNATPYHPIANPNGEANPALKHAYEITNGQIVHHATPAQQQELTNYLKTLDPADRKAIVNDMLTRRGEEVDARVKELAENVRLKGNVDIGTLRLEGSLGLTGVDGAIKTVPYTIAEGRFAGVKGALQAEAGATGTGGANYQFTGKVQAGPLEGGLKLNADERGAGIAPYGQVKQDIPLAGLKVLGIGGGLNVEYRGPRR